MDIQKKLDGTTLTVTVTGHIDTVTAPQLESELSLDSVEELVFDDEDDEDDDDEDEDDEDDDEPVYATTCPECEEEILFDESYLEDGAITCPNCGAKLEFDAEDIDAGDDEE